MVEWTADKKVVPKAVNWAESKAVNSAEWKVFQMVVNWEDLTAVRWVALMVAY
jgi:hypothetical protein